MRNQIRMEAEEEEALYFVQSPCTTVSHSNSAELHNNNNNSNSGSHNNNNNNIISNNNNNSIIIDDESCAFRLQDDQDEAARFALSRYSSSRGSNNSFLHNKKLVEGLPIICVVEGKKDKDKDDDDDDDDELLDDEDDYYYSGRRVVGWWRYVSFRSSSSCLWICFQISCRLVLSLSVALLVFYISTKPPPPTLAIKVEGIRQFELGEGVDGSGVTTKILTCNCSLNLVVENKSKLFGLHIRPLDMAIYFGNLPIAISKGQELYAWSDDSSVFELSIGTKDKPMYGAGRSMEDMMESGKGLPLVIHVSSRSSFHVVWNLIEPKFRHQVRCLLFVGAAYDNKHKTQTYNATCSVTS